MRLLTISWGVNDGRPGYAAGRRRKGRSEPYARLPRSVTEIDVGKTITLKSQKPLFEFAADAWRLSFQRRVGEGVDRNRGSLPFHLITTDDLTVRILVPLPAGEALWIAWNLNRGFG